MNTHGDDEMPKDLDRVHAALDAPEHEAPEELLQRILASRAAGERVILPTGTASPSRFRMMLMRGAIAAVLGFMMLAGLSRIFRSRPSPLAGPATAGFTFPGFDDLGFGTMAAAQGIQGAIPRFEPMTFDTARLHPVRLRYLKRSWCDCDPEGKVDVDTNSYVLARSEATEAGWVLSADRVLMEQRGAVVTTIADSTWFDSPTLHAFGRFWGAFPSNGNGSDTIRMLIGETSVSWHEWRRDLRNPGHLDTVITNKDTAVAIAPAGRYPRLIGSGGEFVFRLMAAPLTKDWKGSMVLAMPGGTPTNNSSTHLPLPVDLEVVGSAQVNSPTSRADCWTVKRLGSTNYTILVRKSDGVMMSLRIEGKFNGKNYWVETTLIGEH